MSKSRLAVGCDEKLARCHQTAGFSAYDGEVATNVANSGVECLSACLSETVFYLVHPNPVTLGKHVLRSPVGRQE